jgi:maltose alpha-D-glucosyltransferase / alpha-amylase
LAERRAKEPPARDIAGLLRSIDYAVSAALAREPNLMPEERATLTQRTREWGGTLAAGYWDSYRETLGQSALWPSDDAQAQRLLDLFLLEKALYEIEYELTNRPSWAEIPIEATLRIFQQRGVVGS